MPVFFDSNLDSPLVFDGSNSFLGGQVSNTRANLLKDDQSSQLINCDISRTGEISTRRGSVQLGETGASYIQGLTQYETPTANYPVAAYSGAVFKFDGETWISSGITFVPAATPFRTTMVQGGNKLYLIDGSHVGIHWWDGTTNGVYSGSTNTDPPFGPYILCWHASRLVAVGSSDPDAIYFSQFLDGGVWNRTKWSLKAGNTTGGSTGGFPSGTNDPITGLTSWVDFNLIVFKKKSIWVVDCDPILQANDVNDTITGFRIKPVHKAIGCIAPQTAAQVGSDIWFLSTNGVRSVSRTLAAETQTEVSDTLSDPVQDIIDRINLDAVGKATAVFWNNHYFLALPLDAAEENNYVLVYSFLSNSWVGLWTGWPVTCWARRNVAANVPRLMFGRSDGEVYEWLDYVQVTDETDDTYTDFAVPIPTTIITRAMTANEPISPKTGLNVEFEFNRSIAEADLKVILDSASPQTLATVQTKKPGAPVLSVTLPFLLGSAGIVRPALDLMAYGPWLELQLKIMTTEQKLSLRRITISAFTETLTLQHVA